MGITGLLPFLKPASRSTNIRQYSGCTVAIDSYCWLHKGAFSCADKLAKGEPTDGHVIYCMKMVNSLLAAGIRPIMVFDGQNLPSKAGTEKKRREERMAQKRKGKNYLIEGKLKEARECFQRCTEVTSDMALDLIKSCRKIGVDCIVAPYEADAQLAYLNKIGIAQIVITEDSDLVLFGCEKVRWRIFVLYQLVYDPLKRRLVPLNPYENGLTGHDIPYAGRLVSNEIAFQIAVGNINVDTMEKVENFDPDLNYLNQRLKVFGTPTTPTPLLASPSSLLLNL